MITLYNFWMELNGSDEQKPDWSTYGILEYEDRGTLTRDSPWEVFHEGRREQ